MDSSTPFAGNLGLCLPIRTSIWRHHASCCVVARSIPTTGTATESRQCFTDSWMLHHSNRGDFHSVETFCGNELLSVTQFRHTFDDYAVYACSGSHPALPDRRVWLLEVGRWGVCKWRRRKRRHSHHDAPSCGCSMRGALGRSRRERHLMFTTPAGCALG